jgi:hypothetical protein
VRLSVEDIAGFKTPVIKGREVIQNPHFQSELRELKTWLDSLGEDD